MSAHRTHATRPVAELLRHTCTLCGGCCEGVRVPLYNNDEVGKVEAAGRDLGIPDPVDRSGGAGGSVLRFEHGACVFLDEGRCRIHAELAPDRKPIPCQQFPQIVLVDGDEVRVGVDPASYGARSSWKHGDPLPDALTVATRTSVAGGQSAIESALVRMCEDSDASLTGLLSVLTREPAPKGQLPTAFAARWAERLSELDLHAFLALDGPGPVLVRGLAPLADRLPSLADGPPPWQPLTPELDAWAVEATRRVLYLRLQANIPNVSVSALFLLGGAVACAWADPRPHVWTPMFTAWIRALRFDLFWKTLAGDTATLMWLGTGQRP